MFCLVNTKNLMIFEKKDTFFFYYTQDLLDLKKYLGLTFPPYWLDGDNINREIVENILYVLLNILLAKSILFNTKVNNNINNDKLLF